MPDALALQALVSKRSGLGLFAPLDLQVAFGRLVELSGPNGAGKSTLLRTLNGVHQQFEGRYEIASCLFQGHRLGLDELLSPLENLHYAAALQDVELSRESVFEALDRFGVAHLGMTRVADLSAGQQRRVTMARWYLSKARVWLLDEPFTALDVDAQALLVDLMRTHVEGGGTIVCATHTPVPLTDLIKVTLSDPESA